MHLQPSDIWLLVSITASFLHITLGSCDFPADWKDVKWVTSLDDVTRSPIIVPQLLTYGDTTAYTSSAISPNSVLVTRHCDSYEKVASAGSVVNYYKRSDNYNGPFELCIREAEASGLIIHAEKNVGGRSTGSSSSPMCKTVFGDLNLFNVYIPATVFTTSDNNWSIDLSQNFPSTFSRAYYRVTYARDAETDVCSRPEEQPSSVASIDYNIISITTCEARLSGFYTPYSGRIKALAELSPKVFGELNDDNGRVLILAYLGSDVAGFYCARYKVTGGARPVITLSLDVTDVKDLKCQKGARYDWYGQHGARKYLRFTFTYNSAFSTVVPPSTGVTAIPNRDDPAYVQFRIDAQYSTDVTNKFAFGNSLKPDIAKLASINSNRISVLDIERDPQDNTYVTIQIGRSNGDSGDKTVDQSTGQLHTSVVRSAGLSSVGGKQYTLDKAYFHTWRDTDQICVNLKCSAGNRCWVSNGDYYCKCTSTSCPSVTTVKPVAVSGLDQTTITIIIAVCVVFGVVLILAVVLVICCRHCKKRKDDSSEQGGAYDYYNNGTTEDRDKEMYSTIGKKPKAYHDKQFVNPQENAPSNIETTGIHL